MKKIFILITAIFGFTFSAVFLQAQHLFSVTQNDLSTESITLLKNQITRSEIFTLSLTKNNENKEMYSVALSSEPNTKIVILNEENGNHITITPANELSAEFQLAPFFIEELRQGVLGNATHYLILETTNDVSVKKVASVSAATKGDIFVPQYFYGKKENVKEALPKDRQIIHIFKERPRLILIDPSDPEMQRYAAQWEEARSYYVYMYQLPDGGLWIYDEHLNIDDDKDVSRIGAGGYMEFTLSGTMNADQRAATEYALELWSEQFAGIVPVDIRITFSPMESGTLGASSPRAHYWNSTTQTWYSSAVGNQLAGYNVVPNQRDIQISMNSNVNFHYGLNANPGAGKYDCVTIMLHEVAHGLGFSSLRREDGLWQYVTQNGSGAITQYPSIFDRQLFEGTTGPCIADLTPAQRAALFVSGNIYAGAPGSHLLAANEGTRVKMYAPTTWAPGSSVVHWDNSVNNFSTFMKYSIGSSSALHSFNTRKIGILLDCGWELPNNPDAIYVTFDANGALQEMPKQEFLPGVPKKLRANVFTRSGYGYTEWNTEPDGTGTSYTDRAEITISNDMTLYAQWQGNTYTLTFFPEGGTVSPTSKPVVYGSPVGELPTPEKGDNIFLGWFRGSTLITEDFIWTYPANATASAKWSGLSIAETDNYPSLQIVPNPANHTIELRIKNYELKVEHVEFYNIFGQLVKSVPFAGETNKDTATQKINISDLSGGVYIVKAGGKAVKLIVN